MRLNVFICWCYVCDWRAFNNRQLTYLLTCLLTYIVFIKHKHDDCNPRRKRWRNERWPRGRYEASSLAWRMSHFHVQFVRNKLNMSNLFRLCRKDEISFDTVAETGNNVEATFDVVERIVQLVAFDNVESTLLLLWTGLKCSQQRVKSLHTSACRVIAMWCPR